jgi:hypothetical protein
MVFGRRRRRSGTAIDPALVAPPFRAAVTDAVRALQQFDQVTSAVRPGPLHDRLRDLRRRIDAGVSAVWETAQRGTELTRVVSALDAERVAADLKAARRADADPVVVDALVARFNATQRLLNSLDSLRDRLSVMEAQLATAVASAADVALSQRALTAAADPLVSLEHDLDVLVTELHALAQATDELG